MGTELNDELDPARERTGAQAEMHSRARSRAYALFARLVSEPSSGRELEAAAENAIIARAIASYGGDLDSLAADHQHVFGFSCPPFESAMLDPESQLGGETSARAREALAAAGIAEGPGGEDPDHLATQLYALALLAGAEADALEDQKTSIAEATRTKARHLLDAHLLRWLPSYASAVRRADRAWPAALVSAIEELVLQHRSTLGAADEADLAFELPPLGISLEEPGTGLDDIARALCRPARAGIWISRDDAARLGRSSATPRGFGERATILENLLRAGAQLGSFVNVIDGLVVLLREASAELGDERLADVPLRLREPWRARIEASCALLASLREASRDAG